MTPRHLRTASLLVALLVVAACGKARTVVSESSAAPCEHCHGAPPATGAHRVHAGAASAWDLQYGDLHVLEDVAPAGAPGYDFGCGNCHPMDEAQHFGHVVSVPGLAHAPDVVLDPAGAPTGSLRARNAPGARYDPVTGTCSGVYCHSSGQDTPVYVTSVAWAATPGSLGCDGCHGDPPRYPSGGAGAPDANSHVNLDVEFDGSGWAPTWEFGHFAGLPGPNHTSKHGGGDPGVWGLEARASPITCQACHFETVDPTNVTSGTFFYYDASGRYDLLPDGDPNRTSASTWWSNQCTMCHGDLGRGRVLPLRHVNGKRDVTFDRRAALPAGYDALLPPLVGADPLRPYYMTLDPFYETTFRLDPGTCETTHVPSCDVSADVVIRDTLVGGRVLTLTLEHAQYDAVTKTCSSVACHLERQRQLDTSGENPVMAPLRWGTPFRYSDPSTCSGCHQR